MSRGILITCKFTDCTYHGKNFDLGNFCTANGIGEHCKIKQKTTVSGKPIYEGIIDGCDFYVEKNQ